MKIKEQNKFVPNWDTLRKTVTVVYENNSIYSEFDFIDYLQFRLMYIRGKIKHKLFIRNEYGGMNLIDEMGLSYYKPFNIVDELYREIIKEQLKLRKNEKDTSSTRT